MDESITFNKPNTIKINFVSTQNFLTELQKRLNCILGLKINPLYNVMTYWVGNYYSDDARKLCYWMYENSKDLYLIRKRQRFEKHIELRENGKL